MSAAVAIVRRWDVEPARTVRVPCESIEAALTVLARAPRTRGPNGPLVSRCVEVDGRELDPVEACALAGVAPLWARETWGSETEYWAGYAPADPEEAAACALRAAGYDARERSPGPGLCIPDAAPDSSEYDGGTESPEWGEDCASILAEINAIVAPHGCVAEWSDDDVVVEAMAPDE